MKIVGSIIAYRGQNGELGSIAEIRSKNRIRISIFFQSFLGWMQKSIIKAEKSDAARLTDFLYSFIADAAVRRVVSIDDDSVNLKFNDASIDYIFRLSIKEIKSATFFL